jgi:hypothetical protein
MSFNFLPGLSSVTTDPLSYFQPSKYLGESYYRPFIRNLRYYTSPTLRTFEYYGTPIAVTLAGIESAVALQKIAAADYNNWQLEKNRGNFKNRQILGPETPSLIRDTSNIADDPVDTMIHQPGDPGSDVQFSEEQLERDFQDRTIRERRDIDDKKANQKLLHYQYWINELSPIDISRSSSAKPVDGPSVPENPGKFGRPPKSDHITPGEVRKFTERAIKYIRDGEDFTQAITYAGTFSKPKTIKYIRNVIDMLTDTKILQSRYKENKWVPVEIDKLITDIKNDNFL